MIGLTAQQKSLNSLFQTEDVYVIPMYQRPYSWEFEQCDQLYKDITDAFNQKKEYFLGNIILARGYDDDTHPSVVDGQQRLITLFLIMKVLTVLCPELKRYKRLLYVMDSREENRFPKVRSDIYESEDNDELKRIFCIETAEIEQRYDTLSKLKTLTPDNCKSRIECNFYLFYGWFSEFKKRSGDSGQFEGFVEHFFRRIYMLPIELGGDSLTDATERALVIFETLNNRGINLEDADIFKSKLYANARRESKEQDFLSRWKSLKADTDNMHVSISDIFRYYYHVMRGINRITSKELNIRDYFVNNPESPLRCRSYADVMDDLARITDILQWVEEKRCEGIECSIWLHILQSYTNKYPLFAIVAYLFHNDTDCDEVCFTEFLRRVTRYVYSMGATTSVKFEIYNIISSVSHGKEISQYYLSEPFRADSVSSTLLLRKGFLLIALASSNENARLCARNIFIDRICPKQETDSRDRIGDYVVITCPPRKTDWNKRKESYAKNGGELIASQWSDLTGDIASVVTERVKAVNHYLETFFNETKTCEK